MAEIEVTAHWVAVACYAAATLAAGFGACFRRDRVITIALGLLGLGAVAHAGALGLRWLSTGHGPFLGRYEAFSSHALAVVLLFLILQQLVPALRIGSALVAPSVFLLLGAALLSPSAPTYPTPALRSPWLTIHVSVAKLALATAVASGTASLIGLIRGWQSEVLTHRLLAYTFFLMSVVLLSGSLWASVAWGSFWSWDPVETWSLAFWAGCAFVLHLRSTGWTGRRWARAVLALAVLGVVSFLGYGHFGVSLHAAYLAP